jgi:hypothetical protein
MTKVGLQSYRGRDDPPPRTVPVSTVVLTLGEKVNVRCCLDSDLWTKQLVAVDFGSVDYTVSIACSLGPDGVEQPRLRYRSQRDFALVMP